VRINWRDELSESIAEYLKQKVCRFKLNAEAQLKKKKDSLRRSRQKNQPRKKRNLMNPLRNYFQAYSAMELGRTHSKDAGSARIMNLEEAGPHGAPKARATFARLGPD